MGEQGFLSRAGVRLRPKTYRSHPVELRQHCARSVCTATVADDGSRPNGAEDYPRMPTFVSSRGQATLAASWDTIRFPVQV